MTTLCAEQWENATESLQHSAELVCGTLIRVAEKCGIAEDELKECCEDFASLVYLATCAMLHVSKCAADQVQIMITD